MRQCFGLNDRPIEHLLIFENVADRPDVIRGRGVMIQMVAFEIGDDGDAGTIMLDRFELEGVQVESDQVQLAAHFADAADRSAACARTDGPPLRAFEHAGDEFGGGRFTVRAGDRDAQAKQVFRAEFKITEDRDAMYDEDLISSMLSVVQDAMNNEILVSY